MMKIFYFIFFFFIWSCSSNNFKSSAGKVVPEDKVLNFSTPCNDDEDETIKEHSFNVKGEFSESIHVTIKGSFCQEEIKAQGSSDIDILFLFDRSRSMEMIDPLLGTSCKRLEAVETLLSAVGKIPGVEVNGLFFGNFADGINSSWMTQKDFSQSYVNSNTLCSSSFEGTNYEAAFDLTKTSLRPDRETHIFMITDGQPSVMSDGSVCMEPLGNVIYEACREVVVDLAKDIRATTEHFNILFLLDPSDPNQGSYQSFLGELTGDPEKVKFASDAAEAADKISEFETPTVELDEKVSASGSTPKGDSFKSSLNSQVVSKTKIDYTADFTIPNKKGTYTLKVKSTIGTQEIDIHVK